MPVPWSLVSIVELDSSRLQGFDFGLGLYASCFILCWRFFPFPRVMLVLQGVGEGDDLFETAFGEEGGVGVEGSVGDVAPGGPDGLSGLREGQLAGDEGGFGVSEALARGSVPGWHRGGEGYQSGNDGLAKSSAVLRCGVLFGVTAANALMRRVAKSVEGHGIGIQVHHDGGLEKGGVIAVVPFVEGEKVLGRAQDRHIENGGHADGGFANGDLLACAIVTGEENDGLKPVAFGFGAKLFEPRP